MAERENGRQAAAQRRAPKARLEPVQKVLTCHLYVPPDADRREATRASLGPVMSV